MQIVTDSGTDLIFSPEVVAAMDVHIVPLNVTLDGKTYLEDVDVHKKDFYKLLVASGNLPTTSQPSAGDFAETYRRLAAKDPEILSIHMTSGLSGTYNSAQAGAKMVPEAKITFVDTKTLTAAAGWQVAAAAQARKAGWSIAQILGLLKRIGDASDCMYTLKELKYLIHGGRISHMKGLIASLLNIKPIIGVEKVKGTYVQMGQSRTFERALKRLVDIIAKKHAPGSELHMQVLHAENPEAAAILKELADKKFKCTWLPSGQMSLVLGAHTGPSMVGIAYGPQSVFDEIPTGS